LAEVRLLLQDALERRLRGGNHTGIAWCYAKIAAVALLLGDVDAAARAEDAARLAAERSRNPETMASVRLLDVQVALGRRDLGAARARLEAWRVLRGPDDDVERLVLPALEAVLLEDDGARADAKRRLEATASDVRVPAGRRRTAAHLLGRLGDGGGLSWVGTTDRSAG
jgi:hypothetical protein